MIVDEELEQNLGKRFKTRTGIGVKELVAVDAAEHWRVLLDGGCSSRGCRE